MLLNKVQKVQVSDTTGDELRYCSPLPCTASCGKKYFIAVLFILLLCNFQIAFAQKVNNAIKSGNEAYKKGDYKSAEKLYKEALAADNNNLAAKFNLGNTLLKQNNIIEAAQYFAQITEAAGDDDAFKAKAYYNKGLTMVKYQKLPEAIEAFKQSLLLVPDDNDTRENLQKAIEELKKQQQQQQPQQQPKQQKKPDPKKQQNKTPNKDVMEQKFDELRDKEKQLQKLLQKKSTADQPEKDW